MAGPTTFSQRKINALESCMSPTEIEAADQFAGKSMGGRTKKALVIGAVSLVAAATCLASLDLDQRYGPYECTACVIKIPRVDEATRAFIDKLRAPREMPFIDRTWVVCNATVCADYVANASGDYEGSNRRAIEGGGAGGGAGGSGKAYVSDPSVVDN